MIVFIAGNDLPCLEQATHDVKHKCVLLSYHYSKDYAPQYKQGLIKLDQTSYKHLYQKGDTNE